MNSITNIIICLFVSLALNLSCLNAAFAEEQEEQQVTDLSSMTKYKEPVIQSLTYDESQEINSDVFDEDTVYIDNN